MNQHHASQRHPKKKRKQRRLIKVLASPQPHCQPQQRQRRHYFYSYRQFHCVVSRMDFSRFAALRCCLVATPGRSLQPLRFHFIIGRGLTRQDAHFLCPTRDAAHISPKQKAGQSMTAADKPAGDTKMRVAFQGEPGAFSEEAALQLLGPAITPVPRPTFDSAFQCHRGRCR